MEKEERLGTEGWKGVGVGLVQGGDRDGSERHVLGQSETFGGRGQQPRGRNGVHDQVGREGLSLVRGALRSPAL